MVGGHARADNDGRSRRWLPDLFGIVWVVAAAGATIGPALARGSLLGPYDYLSEFGLSEHAHKLIQNVDVGDILREFIPWTNLAWTQVHHGILPLWNPYSALGAPLAFNWQSATFSLPALVGYLLPVRIDFTAQVLLTLVIGGTGMYVLARVMRLGPLGAAMAATVFELSGAFMAVLGWPIAGVMSWAGWLFAGAIVVMRGRHRRRNVTLFAVALALSIYAGQPDTLVVLLVGLAVFIVVKLGLRLRRLGANSVGQPIFDLCIATAGGVGLAAPLLLPAAAVSSGSVRGAGRHPAFPPDYLLNVLFQRFNGYQLNVKGIYFGAGSQGLNYIPTAVYVGVIALALAAVALVALRRRSTVAAFGGVAVVAACLVYLAPLVSLLNHLPGLGEVRWVRAVQVLAFALAILSGAGLDALVRSDGDRKVRNLLGMAFSAIAVLLLLVWSFGRGHLSHVEASVRARSFLWPTAEVVIGIMVFAALVVASRRGRVRHAAGNGVLGGPCRVAGVVLLISSTVFLVALGEPWWPSATTNITPTPAITTLQKTVGTSIVGFGTSCWYPPSLGIVPNVNSMLGVHEIDVYDPLTPQGLFTAWEEATGQSPTPPGLDGSLVPISTFCPAVSSSRVARLFGIEFVLEAHGHHGPPGSVFDKTVGNEELYRIPGASAATLSRLGDHGALPPAGAPAKPLSVTYPSSLSWKLVTRAATPQVLRLRLTDLPGWHATIDGKPLKLIRFNRIMLQARIPGGTHTIELHYWPDSFNVGIVLAVCSAVALVALLVVGGRRSRRFAVGDGSPTGDLD